MLHRKCSKNFVKTTTFLFPCMWLDRLPYITQSISRGFIECNIYLIQINDLMHTSQQPNKQNTDNRHSITKVERVNQYCTHALSFPFPVADACDINWLLWLIYTLHKPLDLTHNKFAAKINNQLLAGKPDNENGVTWTKYTNGANTQTCSS